MPIRIIYVNLCMKERLEIVQKILPTGLIAESISSMAVSLGYRSRATLYRIMDGSASTNAVNEFYRKVESTLFLSEETLYNINSTIENAAMLNRLLKSETDDFKNITVFDVLKAFISHDYSIFSDKFKSEALPGLRRLEITDPNVFFTMLSYSYFKSLRMNFYESGKPYRERCAEIMEPLGEKLMELYPANGIAALTVYVYSRSEILNAEAPILWNFITTLANLLQFYATPDIGSVVAKDMHLVPSFSDRSYWSGNNRSRLMLMRAVKHNIPGSGYYDVFTVAADNGKVESVGVITFLSDEVVSYRDKRTGISQLGMVEIDEGNLFFSWENGKESPWGADDHWTRRRLEHSQSLRMLDGGLSDGRLNEAALLSDGFRSLRDCSVSDVVLSRSGVRLSLTDGRVYEISYSVAPFLEYIRPTNDVIVAEQISNGEVFVSWPQMMHCIPLRLFCQINPASTE